MPPQRTTRGRTKVIKTEEDVQPPVRAIKNRKALEEDGILTRGTRSTRRSDRVLMQTDSSDPSSQAYKHVVSEVSIQTSELPMSTGDTDIDSDSEEVNSTEAATKGRKNKEDAKYSCQMCKKAFTRKTHLERHEKSACNTGSKKFCCNFCDKSFTRRDNLRQHIRKHTDDGDWALREKKYQCLTCFKLFYTPSHLQIHMRVHTGERPFKCSHCTKSFSSSGALNKHNRIHTGEKPFQCEVCHFTFALKGTLNRHLKIHTGVKPHKCPYCGKEFIQSGGLKAHMFFHTGENGFKCDQCGREFNRKARLEMHKKYVHDKVKPFECDSCEKSFTRKEDLHRHAILHTGEKPHHCMFCNKKFALRASLNVHMLTHRREEPRACNRCGNAFIRKDCLIRHIRKLHRNEAEALLTEHGLLERDKLTPKESIQESDLTNGKLEDEKLAAAIREMLLLLVEEKLLRTFGWPNAPIDLLLESVIKQCNHTPVRCEDYSYYDRLRENVKLLFTVVIEDDSLKELLNNRTVDEVIVNVIMQANL